MTTTTYLEERQQMQTDFETFWADRTPIDFENREFEIQSATPYVELRFIKVPGSDFQADMGGQGNNRIRYPGVVRLTVYTPAGEDVGAGLQYADDAANHYFDRKHDGIRYEIPTVRTIGSDGVWHRTLMEVDYTRESFK